MGSMTESGGEGMIRVIRSEERHHFDGGWLETYWHFSFGDYYDPANMRWGPLRVCNEDWIQPNSGFPRHPHDNMEIITYVIDGELTHQDSLGNTGTIRPGEIQRMSAGSGIVHAEFNQSPDTPVHLLQMWVLPKEKGLKPDWEQRHFAPEQRKGKLLPVVSGDGREGTLRIHQDATFYISAVDAGQQVEHATSPARRLYLFVVSGEVRLGDQTLHTGDQARIHGEESLPIVATTASELILWDMA